MSWQHRFFCSCTCAKVLFIDTFLICRFRWKVEIISTFSLRKIVAFFLNQSFLCIHVNKVSHYNMVHSHSTIYLKSKMAAYFNLNNNEISKELLLNKFNMILDNQCRHALNVQKIILPHNEPRRSPVFVQKQSLEVFCKKRCS